MRPQSVVLVLFLYAGPVLFTVQRYEEQHRNERKQHTDDGDLLALFTSVLTNTTRDTNTLFLLSYLGPNGNSATGVTSRCVAFEHHFKSHPKKKLQPTPQSTSVQKPSPVSLCVPRSRCPPQKNNMQNNPLSARFPVFSSPIQVAHDVVPRELSVTN